GEVLLEPRRRKAERDCDATHQRVGDGPQGLEPSEERRPELARREEVGAVQRRAVAYTWVLGPVLEADVQPFLAVRSARCELAAHWKPSAPRRTGIRHRIRLL